MQIQVELVEESKEMEVLDITFLKEPGGNLWVDFHVVSKHDHLGHIRISVDDIVRITEA